MRSPARHVAFVALTLLVCCARDVGVVAPSGEFTARVIATKDGDTIRVRDRSGVEFDVRIEGIDCPESGQPFGGVARRFTRVAIFDQTVLVKPVTHDVHGRLVARVMHGGKDLSDELIRNGLAWHYTDYSHDGALAAAEQEARREKRGLWSDPHPIPPWVWRRQPSAVRATRAESIDDEAGPFFGNTSSHVFHAAKCKNAHCKNCSAVFQTAKAAVAAGYRPAGDCLR